MLARLLFKERPAVATGRALYASAVDQARKPAFYRSMGVADTRMGRFELYTLHVLLLVHRLKGRGAAAGEASQALFDAYLEGLDIGLREIGVGDLSMAKKMKKLGRAFYGRLKAWDESLGDARALEALIGRTVLEGRAGDSGPLARYAEDAAAVLARLPDEDLLRGEIAWPEPRV